MMNTDDYDMSGDSWEVQERQLEKERASHAVLWEENNVLRERLAVSLVKLDELKSIVMACYWLFARLPFSDNENGDKLTMWTQGRMDELFLMCQRALGGEVAASVRADVVREEAE